MRFMRPWLLTGVVIASFALGCNKSNEGGTPQSHSSFTITAPPVPTSVKQDNRESVKLSLDRGKDFHKDVKLKAESPDSKIKVELNKDTIKASDSATDFNGTITPAKDAPVGDHKIKVTGTPDGGGTPAIAEFTVKVSGP
jgi:hypothetical protein